MKAKRKTKQAGKRNAERAETTRGAQAAQDAANGCAKRARPVWVDESDAEEITDFDKPSPHLFTSACSFIWDAAETAYRNGDNALLSREGVADALEFIAHGVIIGSGIYDAAGSYDYMLEDWIISQENKKRAAAHYEGLNATAQKLYRLQFWGWFDETKKADKETHKKRKFYLSENASMGELLKGVKRTFYDNHKTADLDCFDKMTDAIIMGYCKDENQNPARVRADWLNTTFSQAGESLARWFDIAALPECKAVAEVREMIADNFGVFPAPFTYTDFGAVELKTNALEKLVFIARATARDTAHRCAAQERPEPLPTQSNGTGAAQCDAAGGVVKMTVAKVEIDTPAPVTVNAPAPNPTGNGGGVSQEKFASWLKHYGGKLDGTPYTKRTVKDWDANPDKRPTAGGVKYSPELRRDIGRAEIWAQDFNNEQKNIARARVAGLRHFGTARQ